jgi:hypothetical protein
MAKEEQNVIQVRFASLIRDILTYESTKKLMESLDEVYGGPILAGARKEIDNYFNGSRPSLSGALVQKFFTFRVVDVASWMQKQGGYRVSATIPTQAAQKEAIKLCNVSPFPLYPTS